MELVERHVETAQLRRLIKDAVRGQGGIGVITGEVATGKSELLSVAAGIATEAGAELLSAVASADQQAYPYAVIEQILSAPGIGSRRDLPSSADRPGPGPGGDQAVPPRVLQAVHRAITDIAGLRPVVITIDDVEHADAQSLACLLHTVRRSPNLPLAAVITLGADPYESDAHRLDELLHQPRSQHLSLRNLSPEAVGVLMGSLAGAAGDPGPEPGLVAAVHEITRGNPLLVRTLVESGMTEQGPAYRRAALACVHRSGPQTERVALGLAVLDGQLDGPTDGSDGSDGNWPAGRLARLLDLDERPVERALARLDGLGLRDGYRLRDASMAAAVLDAAPRAAVRDLRYRTAEILRREGVSALDSGRQLLDQEVTDGAPDWVTEVLRQAAEEALAEDDVLTALRCLEQAGRTCRSESERIAVEAALTRVTWRFRPGATPQHLRAITAAVGSGRIWPVTALRLSRTMLWLGWNGAARCAIDDAAARIATAKPGDPAAADELEITRMTLACTYPGIPAGKDLCASGSDFPRSRPALAVRALHAALTSGGDSSSGAEQVLRTSKLLDSSVESIGNALLALVYLDRLVEAGQWADLFLAEARQRQAPTWTALISGIRALVSLRSGDPGGAREHAENALSWLPPPHWGTGIGLVHGTLVRAHDLLGDPRRAGEILERPVPETVFATRFGLHYLYARGQHQLNVGEATAALADFRTCGERMEAWSLDSPSLVPWRAGAAEALIRLGNPIAANRAAQTHLALAAPGRVRTRCIALRTLALTLPVDRRVALLEESLQLLPSAGDSYEFALTLAALGRTLEELRGPARGRPLLRRALEMAESCRAGALVKALGPSAGAPEEAGTAAPRLTRAERRVAVLAARGLANQEIARTLVITVSTVEQHLTKTYRKLNIKHRHELPFGLEGSILEMA